MMQFVYVRYIGASAIALAVDMALFLAAISLGVASALAAALGYLSGIVAHWLISSRVVFGHRVAERGGARRQQQALFLGSALIGLGLTTAIVGIGDGLGLGPRIAKLIAIGVSFQVTYLLRQRVVFGAARDKVSS